jgi:hypothetical protein
MPRTKKNHILYHEVIAPEGREFKDGRQRDYLLSKPGWQSEPIEVKDANTQGTDIGDISGEEE